MFRLTCSSVLHRRKSSEWRSRLDWRRVEMHHQSSDRVHFLIRPQIKAGRLHGDNCRRDDPVQPIFLHQVWSSGSEGPPMVRLVHLWFLCGASSVLVGCKISRTCPWRLVRLVQPHFLCAIDLHHPGIMNDDLDDPEPQRGHLLLHDPQPGAVGFFCVGQQVHRLIETSIQGRF